jgi:hypothetical protein
MKLSWQSLVPALFLQSNYREGFGRGFLASKGIRG